jgi:hypothetical protein
MHSACDRQSFALGPVESRTGQRGSREKRDGDALQWEESPFSAVQLIGRKSQRWAQFANCGENCGGNSLQSRLSGGDQDIRPLGTTVRKLHVVKNLSGELTGACPSTPAKPVRFLS